MRFYPERAAKAQERLAGLVRPSGIRADDVSLVAGLDVAYGCGRAFGAAVLFSMAEMRAVEAKASELEERVPYIPGLLAFREVGPMISAYLRLSARPDAVLVDGHGVAHPRGFGIASHFGVVARVPSVGVAKGVLVGEERDGYLLLRGERVAAVLGRGRRRIYVSVGHMISLEESVKLVSRLMLGHRLPEPLLLAHVHATAAARSCSGSPAGQRSSP